MNEIHTAIPIFSLGWWIGTVVTITAILLLIRWLHGLSDSGRIRAEKAIFLIVIFHIILLPVLDVIYGRWDPGYSLPLHLCGISRILGAILMLRFNQYAFEFVVLLGMGGALQSFVTPELTFEYSLLAHVEYYISHGFIFFAGFYLLYVKKHQLTKVAWIRTFLIGLVVLSLVGVFNYFFNGNYIYLCKKPIADNPLLIGDWPYYLLCFFGFGFVNIILFHLLFRWWGKRLDVKNP